MFLNEKEKRIQKPLNRVELDNYPQQVKTSLTKDTLMNTSFVDHHSSIHIESVQQTPRKNRLFGNGQILRKGQKMTLPTLPKLDVVVGWDTLVSGVDIDISAFMLNANRKVLSEDWFVFYGQTDSPDRSVHLNPEGTQHDDKEISVFLNQTDQNVSRIVFVLTIDEALRRNLNFSMVKDAYIRLMNGQQEIARFELTDYYNTVTSMMLGELYLHNGQWKFNPIGDGVALDLAGLCSMYGVETE